MKQDQRFLVVVLSVAAVVLLVSVGVLGKRLGYAFLDVDLQDLLPVVSTKGWQVYKNDLYGYSVKYPGDYSVGYADNTGYIGRVDESEYENQMMGERDDIILSKEGLSIHGDFFEIQVIEFDALGFITLEEAVKDNFKKNGTHFQTTEVGVIKNISGLGDLAFEYTFTGEALHTLAWGGISKPGDYKIITVQRRGRIYALFFTDTKINRQILSTLQFGL